MFGLIGFLVYLGLLVVWVVSFAISSNEWLWLGTILFVPGFFVFVLRFAIIKEAHCVAVMRFDELKRIIVVWKGHYLDLNGEIREGATMSRPSNKIIGGLYFLGWFFDSPLKREFSWFSPAEGTETEPQAHTKEQLMQFFLGDKDYLIYVKKAEDADNLALSIECIFMIQVVNPEKAFFKVHDYLVTLYQIAEAMVTSGIRREHFTNPSGDDPARISRAEELKRSFGEDIMINENDRIEEVYENYGLRIKKIWIKDINPSDETDREMIQKTIKELIAGEADAARAKGEKQRQIIEAQADAESAEFTKKKTVIDAQALAESSEFTAKAKAAESGGVLEIVMKTLKDQGIDLTSENLAKVIDLVKHFKSADSGALSDIKFSNTGAGSDLAAQAGIGLGTISQIAKIVSEAMKVNQQTTGSGNASAAQNTATSAVLQGMTGKTFAQIQEEVRQKNKQK